MAIVKMKKLRVMAMADSREELLTGLLRLGCVEISEPDDKLADPAWSALLRRESSQLLQTRSEITDVNTALAAIARYGQLKDGLFLQRHPISQDDFLSGQLEEARQVCRQIGQALQALSRLQSEEGRIQARQAGLRPWAALDMPLEMEGTVHTILRPGVMPGGTRFWKKWRMGILFLCTTSTPALWMLPSKW